MKMRAKWLAFVLAISVVPMAYGQTVNIESFDFGGCEDPTGETHVPKFGENVGGAINVDISTKWARENCEMIVKSTMNTCRENTIFLSNTKNSAYPECLAIFEAQSEACVNHFRQEIDKCGSGAGGSDHGRDVTRELSEEGERAGAPADPWGADAPPAAADPWKDDDPWAQEAPSSASAPADREWGAADVTTPDEGDEEGSNYEALLEDLPGGGGEAGYMQDLEKLEAGQRAEQARRRAEARAAEERRREAERETARRAAAARERERRQAERAEKARRAAARERRQALERAARQRRETSQRAHEESIRQFNRSMQTLQQTRQQQRRAYERQKALDRQRQIQRQRQQQAERRRQQQIYEQQREWDRQTYEESSGEVRPSGQDNSNRGTEPYCPQGWGNAPGQCNSVQ